MSKESPIPEEFVLELFNAAMKNRTVFDIANQYLKPNYLPTNELRLFWKELQTQWFTSTAKSSINVGSIKLSIRKNEKLCEVLADVIQNPPNEIEPLIDSFETFVKQKMFIEIYEDTASVFNKGEKSKAYTKFAESAEKLVQFSIKSSYYEKLFSDYTKRQTERLTGSSKTFKVSTGMDEQDAYTKGGYESGESWLYLAGSGVGKSHSLIHHGITASRRGNNVAHFQAEGTRKQCLDRYDAAWTGTQYHDMKTGIVDRSKNLQKVIDSKMRGEVFIDCFEKFGTKSMYDIRKSVIDMKKMYGEVHVVLIDYFELIEPGDREYSPSEERFRQIKIGRMMKDLAVEQNVVVITATQASAVSPDDLNDPDFTLTRYNCAEDKGKLRPFDGFVTLNQTRDEKKNGIIRLHNDKIRESESGQTMTIVSNLKYSRFYDRKRTLELLDSVEEI
jgi:replicative DNA helicase